MLQFSELSGDWSDRPCYLIGGGTSLRDFDFSKLTDGIKVGCNRSAFESDADVLVTLDQQFARQRRDQIQDFVDSGKSAVLAMPPSEVGHTQIEGATYIYRVRNEGLSHKKDQIYGVHTGRAALNVAFLMGAKDIRLLGYDMQNGKEGVHFHGGYPWQNAETNRFMNKWSQNFGRCKQELDAAGVRVTNYIGSPASILTDFPTRPLEELQ